MVDFHSLPSLCNWLTHTDTREKFYSRRTFNFRTTTKRIEQRYCIKFCLKLSDSQTETIRKIQQAFGEDATEPTTIKEWYNQFKDGRTSAESDSRSGRPLTSRNDAIIDQVRTLVLEDHRITVRELADEMDISIHPFDFAQGFDLQKSGCKVRPKAADDGAKASSSGSVSRHA